jgi:hypothetical protein
MRPAFLTLFGVFGRLLRQREKNVEVGTKGEAYDKLFLPNLLDEP